jgi:hypothetical protein
MFKLNKKCNIYYFHVVVIIMLMMVMTTIIITVNDVIACWGLPGRMSTQGTILGQDMSGK